ncbi:hypothetical protein J2Z48_000990 [Croceifilum oryzae]|uniref:Uncharacterized protein n=1 Tax=Croceifilum oryzae TaxID=1553429 RepID=A0AAJ1WSA4_9BACL|nr:hypothetical protein [Croceifilum oryzae]
MDNRIEELLKDKPITFEEIIEDRGTVRVYGSLDIEKLVKLLLQSKSMKC